MGSRAPAHGPWRVPLMLRAELAVPDAGRFEVFPRGDPVAGTTAEGELDDALRRLSLQGAWAWRLWARVAFEGLREPVEAEWVLQRGRFVPARQAIPAALLAAAHDGSVTQARARELAALAERIRGRPLDPGEVPARLRPQPAPPSRALPAWSPNTYPSPVGFCRCGCLVPRVRAYVGGKRRAVFALHGLDPGRPGPCPWTEAQWRTYDPVLPQPYDSEPDPARDLPMDAGEWRRNVWGSVPAHLGGPFTPGPSRPRRPTALADGARVRRVEAPA